MSLDEKTLQNISKNILFFQNLVKIALDPRRGTHPESIKKKISQFR